MRKSIIVFFLLSGIYPLLAFAQDPGMPDSVIFGNLDGSPIYSDRVVHLPLWFKNDEDLTFMTLSVGIDRAFGHFGAQILYNYPLNSWDVCWDTLYSSSPFPEFPDYLFMTLVLMSDTGGEPNPPLNTDSSWQQILSIRLILNSDSSLIGDTTCIAAFWPGISSVSAGCIIIASPTEVSDRLMIPIAPSLLQNYPNPFNAQTTISYSLPTASDVTIDIFDILGRKITSMNQGRSVQRDHIR